MREPRYYKKIPTYKPNLKGLENIKDTTVVFDDLITQVGRAIAKAQEIIDQGQIEFQKNVVKTLKEGKVKQIEITPRSTFVIPETTLEMKLNISIENFNSFDQPTLLAIPLNAGIVNKNDVNIDTMTNVKLRFVPVPKSIEPPAPPLQTMSTDDVVELTESDSRTRAILEENSDFRVVVNYISDPEIWKVGYLLGSEPVLIVLIDDKSKELKEIIYKINSPTNEDLEEVAAPSLKSDTIIKGRVGDILTIQGSNFLTLSGQTILTIDDMPIPILRLTMNSLAFKVPPLVDAGNVVIETPAGTTEEAGENYLSIYPELYSFSPTTGYYDSNLNRGSKMTLTGSNLRYGCNIRFANGKIGKNAKILSREKMEVEVPPNAGSGFISLIHEELEDIIPQNFVMLPSIDSLQPIYAKVGEEVVISGNNFNYVTQLEFGKTIVPRKRFTFISSKEIRFIVPTEATYGVITLKQVWNNEVNEVKSKKIFKTTPTIDEFADTVVTAGSYLKIKGNGFDPDLNMMAVLFTTKTDYQKAEILSISPDRKSLNVKVPLEAVTGFIRLISKRIYSEKNADDTASLSPNKLFILDPKGNVSDVLLVDHFDKGLAKWKSEAGKWQIMNNTLYAEGIGRLTYNIRKVRPNIFINAEILRGEIFGFSFTSVDGKIMLQAWFDLMSRKPILTISTLDKRRRQQVIGTTALSYFPGGNYLIQAKLMSSTLTIRLDQNTVYSMKWDKGIKAVSLLSNSRTQGWDNVSIMTNDVLKLPAPKHNEFIEHPIIEPVPELSISSFTPLKGLEGTPVRVRGRGFDKYTHFYFGPIKATLKRVSDIFAEIIVPPDAQSGEIVAKNINNNTVTKSRRRFILPPKINAIYPIRAIAGQKLYIVGSNLPEISDTFTVKTLGEETKIISASSTMLTTNAPDIDGEGMAEISYKGYLTTSPFKIKIQQEIVLLDFLEQAENSSWSTSGGKVRFGNPGSYYESAVQLRTKERMEDGKVYDPVLYIHPPTRANRALRGVYPIIQTPETSIKLIFELGMLWKATAIGDDIMKIDGVIFEIGFLLSETGEEIKLLDRTICYHDNSLERFTIDASTIKGKQGQFTISVFPGRYGLRDEVAIVKGQLIQRTK